MRNPGELEAEACQQRRHLEACFTGEIISRSTPLVWALCSNDSQMVAAGARRDQ